MFYLRLRQYINCNPGMEVNSVLQAFPEKSYQETKNTLSFLVQNNFVRVINCKVYTTTETREQAGQTPQNIGKRTAVKEQKQLEKDGFLLEQINNFPQGVSIRKLQDITSISIEAIQRSTKRLAFAGKIRIEMRPNNLTNRLDQTYIPSN